MADTTAVDTGKPLTGTKVLLILGAFFGVMFAVNGLMAYDAISTFRGEVSRDPYEEGIHYNTQIAAAEAQSERHWKVDVTLAGAVRATFRDEKGEPLTGLDVTGAFGSPSDMRRDHKLSLKEIGPGVYVSDASPPAGVWDLRLKAARGDETLFQSTNRVTLQ